MPHFLDNIPNRFLIMGDGIEVAITQMSQFITYKNIIEGVPGSEDNAKIMRLAPEKLKEFTWLDEIYIVDPIMVPVPAHISYSHDEMKETLPKITCMVKVNHQKAFRDYDMDYSQLGILWFQNEFAMPIDQAVLNQMANIPFKKLCGEFGYFM